MKIEKPEMIAPGLFKFPHALPEREEKCATCPFRADNDVALARIAWRLELASARLHRAKRYIMVSYLAVPLVWLAGRIAPRLVARYFRYAAQQLADASWGKFACHGSMVNLATCQPLPTRSYQRCAGVKNWPNLEA